MPAERWSMGKVREVLRLRLVALRQETVVENVDLRAACGLDRALFQRLAAGDWIDRKQNRLIIGPLWGPSQNWSKAVQAADLTSTHRSDFESA